MPAARVFPYTSFVQNRAQSRLLYMLIRGGIGEWDLMNANLFAQPNQNLFHF